VRSIGRGVLATGGNSSSKKFNELRRGRKKATTPTTKSTATTIQPEEVKTKTERSKSAFVLIVRQRQCLKERQRREETKEKKERKTMENATTAFNLKSCWHSINP